jgi:hypothetical protein
MGNYVKAADAIRDAFECAVVIVHHCGYEGTRPRGHSSLIGALDAQVAVSRVALVEYMKDGRDGPEGTKLISRLERVDLGFGDEGDEISSCVVVPVIPGEGVMAAAPRAWDKGAKLRDSDKIAHMALFEVIKERGVVPPPDPHIPKGMRCALMDDWKSQAYNRGLGIEKSVSARRQVFHRAKDLLTPTGATRHRMSFGRRRHLSHLINGAGRKYNADVGISF